MSKFQSITYAISRLSMLLSLALLPFFVVPVPWMTTAQSKMALMVLLLSVSAVTWVIARLLEGTMRVPAFSVLMIGALLPIAYLVSTLITGATSLSLLGTGIEQDTLASACMWFSALTLSALAFSENPLRSIDALRALFLGGLILLVLQILYLFFPASLSFGGALTWQGGNILGTWHDFGILAAFFVFLGVALIKTPVGEGLWRYFLAALSLFSLLFLIILNLSDVWIALASVSFLFFLHRTFAEYRLQGSFPSSLRSTIPWLIIVLMSVSLVFFGDSVNNVLPPAMRITHFEVRPSWQGTYKIGQQVLVHPATLFFGAGPNTFTHEWGLYKPADINATQFWNADFNSGIGLIPTSLITVGIANGIAWALLFAALLWLAWTILFNRSQPASPHRSVVEPLALATIYLFSFFVLYVPGPALSILPFLSLGILMALAGSLEFVTTRTWSVNAETWGSLARIIAVLFFGAVTISAGFGIGRAIASEATLNRGILSYNNSGDVSQAINIVASAIRMYPDSDRAQRAAVELGILQLRNLTATSDLKSEESRNLLQATLSQTIDHGLKAVSINSDEYQNWLGLAMLYSNLAGEKVEGAYENARSAYSHAQAANPTNPLPLLQLAQLEILQGNLDAALKDLESALALKKDFAPAYYLSSQVYASRNDFKNAIPAAAQTVQYAPEDPLGWYNLGLVAYGGGYYPDAVIALQKALTIQPQYANALYVLGLAHYKQGRILESIQAFTDLDKLDPGQPSVVQFLENLRTGKPLFPETSSAKESSGKK